MNDESGQCNPIMGFDVLDADPRFEILILTGGYMDHSSHERDHVGSEGQGDFQDLSRLDPKGAL